MTNDEISAKETSDFKANKPQSYFAYVSQARRELTTWTGETLRTVKFGREYRDNMGATRQSITVDAINGLRYYGTYFKSTGDYARIRAFKTVAS